MSGEVGRKAGERAGGVFAPAAHLAQPHVTVVGLDLDERADEPAPVRAVAVQQRRVERNGDGRGPDGGDRGHRGSEFSKQGSGDLRDSPRRGNANLGFYPAPWANW